jgi:cytochrome c
LVAASALFLVCSPASADNKATATSLSQQGDPSRGKLIFNRCKACHNLTNSTRRRLGPNLDNLFGKKAGTSPNYRYSRALKDTDFIWTEIQLNEWLTKPNAFLPGNKMAFAGLEKSKDRKDLIAYLRRATVKTK